MMRNKMIMIMAMTVGMAAAQPAGGDVPLHDGGWTLRDCADYAVAHNIEVKQSDNVRKKRQLQLSTDRNSRLPGVDATVGQNFSFGRGLTADNTYTDKNISNTSLNIGASMPIFTGLRITNAIKLSRLNLAAATADLEKAKNDIRMRVAEAYVQILYDMEIADVACRQISIDSMQVARLQAMLDAGRASEAELSQQKATLAQSRLTATQADNNRRMALLTLSQLLELHSPEGFSVVRPDVEAVAVGAGGVMSPDAVFAEAVGIRPEVRAEELRLSGTEHSIRIARSSLYPQVSLSAGIGTNYYDTSGFKEDAFSRQIKNNFSQYVGLSLSIPLFERFQMRNSVRSAKIDRDNQQLALDKVRKALYKDIQQVCCNAVAAGAKYESCVQASRSSDDAFVLIRAKYENGKANITEFNEAKNNMLAAKSNLVQAKYEYIYQQSLVGFYRGKELAF